MFSGGLQEIARNAVFRNRPVLQIGAEKVISWQPKVAEAKAAAVHGETSNSLAVQHTEELQKSVCNVR